MKKSLLFLPLLALVSACTQSGQTFIVQLSATNAGKISVSSEFASAKDSNVFYRAISVFAFGLEDNYRTTLNASDFVMKKDNVSYTGITFVTSLHMSFEDGNYAEETSSTFTVELESNNEYAQSWNGSMDIAFDPNIDDTYSLYLKGTLVPPGDLNFQMHL